MLRSTRALRRAPLALLVALGLVASIAAGAVANPSSSEVRDDLEAAEARYEEIDQQRGQAQNAYNDALGALEYAEATLDAIQRDLTGLRAEAAALTGAVEDHVRLLHKVGPGVELSTIVSRDPSDLGLRSTTMRQILERRSSDLELLTATNTAIAAAEVRQAETVALAAQHTTELEARNAELETLFDETADEVTDLEELLEVTVQREEEEAARQRELERRRELERQQATTSTSSASASAAGPAPSTRSSVGSAVQVALGQLGKPYAWGATGPGSFDCSGLVTYAYRAVGISHLPRSSSAMYSATTRISRADLRPGDLVFYHSPVSHVAIYIGGGQVVEAPNSGSNVRVRADGLTRRGVVGFGRV
ncbi:MAG: NlpC/P60 family protein [Nitriliruptoraceae bacterium]